MEHSFTSTRDAVVVQTSQGKLRGFYYDDVFNFWGVRYARARRFRMPVPPESWEGVRTAMAYGHVSPLLEDPIPDFELTVPHRFWPEGEDCLNLNIAPPTLGSTAAASLTAPQSLISPSKVTTWPETMTSSWCASIID